MTSANIYLYECISLLAPGCDVCLCVCVFVFVCVCDIKSGYKQKPHYVSDLSRLDVSLRKIHSKIFLVLRYQGFLCVGP